MSISLPQIATVSRRSNQYELLIATPPNTVFVAPLQSLDAVIAAAKNNSKYGLQWRVNLEKLEIIFNTSNKKTDSTAKITAIFDDFRDLYIKICNSPDAKPVGDHGVEFTVKGNKESVLIKMNALLKNLNLLFADGVVRKLLERNGDSRFILDPPPPKAQSPSSLRNPPLAPIDFLSVTPSPEPSPKSSDNQPRTPYCSPASNCSPASPKRSLEQIAATS